MIPIVPRPCWRRAALVLTLLGALAGAGTLATHLAGGADGPGEPYTVAQVDGLLARETGYWRDRIVVVRANAEPCPWWGAAARLEHCAGQSLVLLGAPSEAAAEPLPVLRPAAQPLLSILRRLPLLGALLPAPRVLHAGVVATYRVRVHAIAEGRCGTGVCYQVLLLGAAL
jgi:hypothetical protein